MPDSLEDTEIVCLCGSTRFMDAFHEANRKFSMEGKIVLSVEIVTSSQREDSIVLAPGVKELLDSLHLRKIDLCDFVYVLNVGKYIGESTANEIRYANDHNKPVMYLEETWDTIRDPNRQDPRLKPGERWG